MTHFDRRQVRRAFGRAASSYASHAVLQREVESRLLERLDLLNAPPKRILDVGCGPGHASRILRKHYRNAEVIALDFALPMLQQARRNAGWWNPYRCVCADASALPLPQSSIDLLFCNLCLQWCEDLSGVFNEFHRVLRPDGLVLISTFGANTLHELRTAWQAADATPHVNRFIDIVQIGNALQAAGLRDPVLDVECLTLTYSDAHQLMRELKAIGANNADTQRSRSLTGKRHLQQVIDHYETFRQNGRLPATYEVIYAHAFGVQSASLRDSEDGTVATFPIEKLRGSRRRK